MWCCSRMESPLASQSITAISPAPNASSAPSSTGMPNLPTLSLVSSPTVRV